MAGKSLKPVSLSLLAAAAFMAWDTYLVASRLDDAPAVNMAQLLFALVTQAIGAAAIGCLLLPEQSRIRTMAGKAFHGGLALPILLGTVLGTASALHALHYGNCSRISFNTSGPCSVAVGRP